MPLRPGMIPNYVDGQSEYRFGFFDTGDDSLFLLTVPPQDPAFV
jgi:hypothetical protein